MEKGFLEAVCLLLHIARLSSFTSSLPIFFKKIPQLNQPPPAYFTVYPPGPLDSNRSNARGASSSSSTAQGKQKSKPQETLISRFHLQDRITDSVPNSSLTSDEQDSGKAQWEESAEKREASLKERKARMILAARQ
jgi:hypothetical protein